MPNEPVSRCWRRYLRFSVRGLIVVVLVIGLGLGWIVRGADAARGGGGDHERRRPGNIRTAIQESRG